MKSSKPRFRTNQCVAIHLRDLKKADRFYKRVLGFKRIVNEKNLLGYDTGHIEFYIDRGRKKMYPILSLTVKNIEKTVAYLRKTGAPLSGTTGGECISRIRLGLFSMPTRRNDRSHGTAGH